MYACIGVNLDMIEQPQDQLATCEMSIGQFLDWWDGTRGDDLLYLKDWNFAKDFPAVLRIALCKE